MSIRGIPHTKKGAQKLMIITKGSKMYSVSESSTKWIVKVESGRLEVSYDISKEICKTEAELREYVLNNEIF